MRNRAALAFTLTMCIGGVLAAPASPAPAARLDHCLVGAWTLTGSVGVGTGAFKGVAMTISPAGVVRLDYTRAHPFVDAGMATTFRGHSTLDVSSGHSSQPFATFKTVSMSLTERNALVTGPWHGHDPILDGTYDYTCASHALKIKVDTDDGMLDRITFAR